MARKDKILLLDFDEIQNGAIFDFLNSLGDFEPIIRSTDKNQLNEVFQEYKISIIVQNITPEGMEIKDLEYEQPILIVEPRNSKPQFVHKETIKSPFRLQQFEIKIRSILRQQELKLLERLSIFGVHYNAARHALIAKNGEEVKLTDKEVEIISYLNQARPNCVTREELLREVWRYNEGVTTHTLETHIYRLRQKLNSLLGDKEALITEEGGYKLLG